MSFVTYALVPSVPEEGSRPVATFVATLRTVGSQKNSGTRGGGSWDREAKSRLPNSALSFTGGLG